MITNQNNNKTYFAEIVESSATHFKAQCWQLGICPPSGSLVAVEMTGGVFFAMSSTIFTGCADGLARVYPYHQTPEQLQVQHPEIFEFLHTILTCLVVGDTGDECINYHSPGIPAPIHAFVREATNDECEAFFGSALWVPVLCGHFQHGAVPDELFIAILANLRMKKLITQATLEGFLDAYMAIADGEYRRLRLFVQRVQQLMY